jgi:hypothetical protein
MPIKSAIRPVPSLSPIPVAPEKSGLTLPGRKMGGFQHEKRNLRQDFPLWIIFCGYPVYSGYGRSETFKVTSHFISSPAAQQDPLLRRFFCP